jgi:alpha-tubulin suppressor-like RCC1 family protein
VGGLGYAVRADGTLWTWGYSDVPVHVLGIDQVTAVAGGLSGAYALRGDHTVWRLNPLATPTPVPNLTDVTAIAGDGSTDYALRSDGTVWAWGANYEGELGTGSMTTTGSDTPVQVHNLTGVTAISAYGGGEAVRGDGTVWVWGQDALAYHSGNATAGPSGLPVQVAGLTGVTAVAGQHALKADGTVWSWGYDGQGNLGNGTRTVDLQATPVQTTISGVTGLGQNLNGAILADGTARTWGDNLFGQLGTGRTGGEEDRPVAVTGLTGVLALAGTTTQGYALTAH